MTSLFELLKWAFSGIGILFLTPLKKLIKRIQLCLLRQEFLPERMEFRTRPAIEKDFVSISETAAFYLRKEHCINLQSLYSWNKKNKEIFVVSECKSSEKVDWRFCGYYSIIPLTSTAFTLLRNSKIQDFELTEESILSFNYRRLSEIYIMDLMTNYKRCKYRHCCKFAGGLLIKKMRACLRKVKMRNPAVKKVFTIIASQNGERLAERSGFSLCTNFRSPYGWKLYEMDIKNV